MSAKKTNIAKPISTSSEWTFDLLKQYDEVIGDIATEFKLDTYPNQMEVITAEQMMDAYSAVGMPVGYSHWSFGKQFLTVEKNYKRGQMGLAYELVINSNPCIAYLMEENTMAMQALVIAHACYGHNSFFKGNYLFKTWTSPEAIIDYLIFARKYVADCEERYGIDNVESLLDAAHALMNFGVDRYRKPVKISLQEEKQRQLQRAEYLQSQVNELWRTIPTKKQKSAEDTAKENFPADPEENILYFLEKNAPLLEPWQREILRIVRKISQYFYPQKQTKVMNEGWATFWHYTLINELYSRGFVTEQFMLEVLHNHTNVIYQPEFDSAYFSGINPYTLGFSIFMDIKRICEEPTDEDKQWFPDLCGSNWVDSLHFAMQNFKDESFIAQYLSPKVIRDLKLFALLDNEASCDLEINYIHDDPGYQEIRQALSEQYNLSQMEPNIQVFNVDHRGDRTMILQHVQHNKRPLDEEDMQQVMKHLHSLWGFTVKLETKAEDNTTSLLYQCPEPAPEKIAEDPP